MEIRMAGVMLLALTLARLASGARYGDYGAAGKLPDYGGVDGSKEEPQYGGSIHYQGLRDEYNEHSSYLPLFHDYRGEGEFNGKTDQLKNVDDAEVWETTSSKHRRKSTPDDDDGNIDTLDKYSPEEMVPKFRCNNCLSPKHPSRLKVRDLKGIALRNKPVRQPVPDRIGDLRRKHSLDDSNSDHYQDTNNNDFNFGSLEYNPKSTIANRQREIKHGIFKEGSLGFHRKAITFKVVRRRPRDKFESLSNDNEYPLEDLSFTQKRLAIPKRVDEIDRTASSQRNKVKKNFAYDYYDMKRVKEMQNKLPSLFQEINDHTDFAAIYPGKEISLFKKWPGFKIKVRPVYDKLKTCDDLLKVLDKNVEDGDLYCRIKHVYV